MATEAQAPAITSPSNPRIVEARKLKQRKYRQASARFLVEGLQLLHMALDGRATPHEVFYCAEQFTGAEAPRCSNASGRRTRRCPACRRA